MISLRHRSASGDLENGWEYDPAERRVHVAFKMGREEMTFSIEVCAAERLSIGAHPIKRLDAESWRVLPERVIRTWRDRVERLETIRCPFNGIVGYFAIALTNTPADVSALFEVL